MAESVRERSRSVLRAAIAESVCDYFAENGFDAVTVDEVSHGVGISRATFFRYFGSKEDAVVASVQSSGVDFAAEFRALDVPAGTLVWHALRLTFEPTVLRAELRGAGLRARIRMIHANPSLRSRLSERRQEQVGKLTTALTETMGDQLSAQLVCRTAFAVLDLALSEWATDENLSFRETLDLLFEHVLDLPSAVTVEPPRDASTG